MKMFSDNKMFSEISEVHERLAARYPREVSMDDGTRLTLTPMVASDWQLLEEFLWETPADERRFFRHEASDSAVVQQWCSSLDYRHNLPLLAWYGDRIAADAVLHRDPGLWTAHLGRGRLLVSPAFRGRGIGAIMMQELTEVARELSLHRLVYECGAEQQGLVSFLRRMGFVETARLPEFIRDQEGRFHDMVVMVLKL